MNFSSAIRNHPRNALRQERSILINDHSCAFNAVGNLVGIFSMSKTLASNSASQVEPMVPAMYRPRRVTMFSHETSIEREHRFSFLIRQSLSLFVHFIRTIDSPKSVFVVCSFPARNNGSVRCAQ